MKQFIVIFIASFMLLGCKSKAVFIDGKAKDLIAIKKIADGYNKNKSNFNTVYIRAKTKFKDENQTLNFTSEIKILKNEKILISVRFLGITIAKGLITPTEVKYYEKNGNKFFEGDFSTLSNWLGADLDFYKLQNMLLGKAFVDLNKGKYINSIEDELFKLEDQVKTQNVNSFYFEASKFLLKKQAIEQLEKQRKLNINYVQHKKYKEAILPLFLLIEATQHNQSTQIGLEYNKVTFNEELSFPYNVPNGYKQIYIE